MVSFIKYLWLRLKRTAAYTGSLLMTAALLSGCMVLLVLLLFGTAAGNTEKNEARIGVGIVGAETDSYTSAAVRMLQGMESVVRVLDIREMTEETAKKQLSEGTIAMYLLVPEGFIESVMTGENKKIVCVSGGSENSLLSGIMDGLMEAYSRMLIESQNAVYGLQRVLLAAGGTGEEVLHAIDSLNIAYFNLLADRGELFELKTGEYRKGLSVPEYYFCALLTLFLLFFSLGGMQAFLRRDLSFERQLLRAGIGAAGQTLAGGLSCFLMAAAGLLPAAVLFWLMARQGIFFGQVGVLQNGAALAGFFCSAVPAVLLASAVHLLIFECAGTAVDCTLAETVYALVSAYSAGCMYPSSFLPKALRGFGSLLPTGKVFLYLQRLIAAPAEPGQTAVLLLYTAALLSAAAVIRSRRLENR